MGRLQENGKFWWGSQQRGVGTRNLSGKCRLRSFSPFRTTIGRTGLYSLHRVLYLCRVNLLLNEDTIVAISTPPGLGAIGVIRLSGPEAIKIVDSVFSKDLSSAKGYTVHFGRITPPGGSTLDEVIVNVFRAPRSYTREDVAEVSFHGSSYILQEALNLFVQQGARPATAGEFTQRAFLNGALDLAQAEAVADLIASTSAKAHEIALNQMRGGVSRELKTLRSRLLDFTSLIELELDFGEEDVEFADRTQLLSLIDEMKTRIGGLISSFSYGNAIKRGVPTAIIGKPNAGKSTLLNALLQENRAIVSHIAGTTRDVVEDRLVIEGIEFRLQDTAGIRETSDEIEKEGVSRSIGLAKKAGLVIYVFDPQEEDIVEAKTYVLSLDLPESVAVIYVANKVDLLDYTPMDKSEVLHISAKEGLRMEALRGKMVTEVGMYLRGSGAGEDVIISNVRHLEALRRTYEALVEVAEGLEVGLSGDLVSIDLRSALGFLGEITGEISTDEVLGNIFGKFCIGK